MYSDYFFELRKVVGEDKVPFHSTVSKYPLILCLALAACGGGGGTATPDAVEVSVPTDGGSAQPPSRSSSDEGCQATLFHSPTIGEDYLDRVMDAYTFGCGYLGDVRTLELWLTANNASAAESLRDVWCQYRLSQDSSFLEQWCERSQIGVDLANYVRWSSVYYNGLVDAHHQNNLHEFSSNPDDPSAEYVTIHEFFHAYQMDHLDEAIYSTPEDLDIQSGRTGDGSRPWHSEGSADLFGHLLTELSGRPGQLRGYFESGEDCWARIDDDFSLWDLTYEADRWCGYHLGAWSIAYLISEHSIEAYLAFYDDLNAYGFFDGWLKNFGVTTYEFDENFRNWFLQTSRTDKLQIIDEIVSTAAQSAKRSNSGPL